jgi:hypothetical protein
MTAAREGDEFRETDDFSSGSSSEETTLRHVHSWVEICSVISLVYPREIPLNEWLPISSWTHGDTSPYLL